MAQAIVQMSCAKLRSANGDVFAKRLNFPADLQGMTTTLEDIQAALADAERRSVLPWLGDLVHRNPDIRDDMANLFRSDLRAFQCVKHTMNGWLKRVRKASYDIMDMVDELQSSRTLAAGKMTSRMLPSLAIRKNRMANKMKEVKEELGKITEESQSLRFAAARGALVQITAPQVDDEAMILGRGECVEMIMDALSSASNDGAGEGALPIIFPIVGFQGIGKTTLARMVFKHAHFQEYNFRVWVSVSPEFDLCRICESIISQVSGGGGMSHDGVGTTEDVTKRLHGLFTGKKVLIVLDDLWEQDPVELDNLKRMLISAGGSSTNAVVIVTTAIGGIASKICTGVPLPYYPNLLSDDMCWTIIKEKSRFEDRPKPEKQELEEIGRKIASNCRGRPSAAQEVGRALRNEGVEGWLHRVDMQTPEITCTFRFMIYGYRSMPPSLRLCFAYCAIFPEGHDIVKDDLIHQWIALDLVQSSDVFSARQLAEEYIRRLLEMSFLRATKPAARTSGKDDKGATLFTMDDRVHDLARYLMFDELIINAPDGTPFQTEYCRYAMLTNTSVKLSSILPSQLRALRCVGCSKTELTDDSFSFARCLRVLGLKESSMQKLPDSISQLRHLKYLNLSGCSRLFMLPESFGHLINLSYIDLSGCSGLVKLPQSVGKLVNLVHITLSGCSELVNLPESFGDLTNLLHVDLSRCCGLENLPKSFRNLTGLVYLDLSFWSCFELIQTALGSLTNLQHLNLSHPCCYLAQHRSHLHGLKDVMGKLTKLKYLNLSMFLNPIFYYQSEKESREYIQSCISGLCSLEHLDLSHNIFLPYMPATGDLLSKLHTLDLSGCIRLKRIYRWMGEIDCLKLNKCRGLESCLFVVHADDSSSSLVQLEDVNCQELEIRCLEKVKSTEEAQKIRLVEKSKVQELKLCWTVGSQGSVEDSTLLGKLQPPHNLQCLELHGYNDETCLPAWWWTSCHLLNLVEVTMEDFPRCKSLPPLGLLPNLQRLILRRMAGITRIDAGDLSGGNKAAFSKLSNFTIVDMGSLEEFNTSTYCSGDEEFIFPSINKFVIKSCPKLSFGPYPPRAQMFHISACDQVMSSIGKRGIHDMEGPSTCSTCTQQTELVVESCNLPLGDWSLLHLLPALHTLSINKCCHLTIISPKIIEALSSLQSLCFSHCGTSTVLPDKVGELISTVLQDNLGELTSTVLPDNSGELTSTVLPAYLNKLTSTAYLNKLTSTELQAYLDKLTSTELLAYLDKLTSTELQAYLDKLTSTELLAYLDKLTSTELQAYLDKLTSTELQAYLDKLTSIELQAYLDKLTSTVLLAYLDKLTATELQAYLDKLTSTELQAYLDKLTPTVLLAYLYKFTSKVLPDNLGELTSKVLLAYLDKLTLTVLPDNLGELTSLHELQIVSCRLFNCFPQSMQHLTSLRLLLLRECKLLKKLPEWLGDLTSLQKLAIDRCARIEYLPKSTQKLANLKDLHIFECPNLKRWCELEENKKIIAHIPNKIYSYISLL